MVVYTYITEQQSLEEQQERLEEKLQAVQAKVAELPDTTPELRATAAAVAAERLRATHLTRQAEEQRAKLKAAREAQKTIAQGVEEANRLLNSGGGVAAALAAAAEHERGSLTARLGGNAGRDLASHALETLHQVCVFRNFFVCCQHTCCQF